MQALIRAEHHLLVTAVPDAQHEREADAEAFTAGSRLGVPLGVRPVVYADVPAILEALPKLPNPLRAAILALVRAALI